jgi:hypothetical protein
MYLFMGQGKNFVHLFGKILVKLKGSTDYVDKKEE